MDLPGATDLYLLAMDEIHKFSVWHISMVSAIVL